MKNVNLEKMSKTDPSKREAILAAAATLFRQYGYRRTSMDDIAKQTGVSRPSLYSYFANKDEVFRGVSMEMHEEALAHAERCLKGLKGLKGKGDTSTLEKRLEGALSAKLAGVLTFGDESPHGNEICDEANRLCGDIVLAASDRFQDSLTAAFKSAARGGEIDLKRSGLSARAAAELLRLGAYGLTRGAVDSATFYKRLGGFVGVFVDGLR